MHDPVGGAARLLLLGGFVLVAAGLVLLALGRFLPLGHLPGDFTLRGRHVSVFVPLATCLLLSLVLTLLLNLLRR